MAAAVDALTVVRAQTMRDLLLSMDYEHGGLMQSCTMRRSATVSRAAANVKKAPAQGPGASGQPATRHQQALAVTKNQQNGDTTHASAWSI